MDPARLAVWTSSIGVNYSTFQPSDKQILERYLLKFGRRVGEGRSFAKFVTKFAMLSIFPLREISCEI